jgi:hypothetical protein
MAVVLAGNKADLASTKRAVTEREGRYKWRIRIINILLFFLFIYLLSVVNSLISFTAGHTRQ